MKVLSTKLILLCATMFFFLSCEKKEKITVSDEGLTQCSANETCTYTFKERSDLNVTDWSLKPGDYRLFLAKKIMGPMTNTLYIKAPMEGTSFSLNTQDIIDGKVKYNTVCPSCDYIAFKVVGGYVKGVNLTPNKPSTEARWLLEAKILLEAEGNPTVKHTLDIKQYYDQN